METSSRNSLQTISPYSAARSIGVVPPPLNQTPRKSFTDSNFTLKITGAQGESVRARSGKGVDELPPAYASPLGSSSSRARGGPGPGWGGPERGPSLLTSRGPLLLTFSRSLSSAAYGSTSWRGGAGRRKEPAGTLGAAPSSRPAGLRTRTVDAPTGAPGRGGRAAFRALGAGSAGSAGSPISARLHGPQPLPAHPGGPGDALAPGPSPPPSPGGGAREAVTSRGARWQHLPAR